MDLKGHRLILASNSPRRKELLKGLEVDFEVDTQVDFEEKTDPAMPVREIPVAMSVGKSHGFHRPLEKGELLLTADTMVFVDSVVLGKPHSRQEAFSMLRMLSGRDHEVITAITLRSPEREKTMTDSTNVRFRELTDEEINYYIDRYKPFDKAGAYGVQEWTGYAAVTRVEGSFFNVMGLPVHLVYDLIRDFIL